MVQTARIRLSSTDLEKLEEVSAEIKGVADKTGVKIAGPIPLPTKKVQVTTQKPPSGEGTITWDKYELRLHKRVIYMDANERALRMLMRIRIPEDVTISLDLM
jgi:small subunit ribosomal protein S10